VWPMARVDDIAWGPVRLTDVGIAGLPGFFQRGASLGDWYSQKTASPVEGFLGPNAFKAFRVEIDYASSAVYFERGAEVDAHDMDLVGLTLQPQANGDYRVIGIVDVAGAPSVAGVEPGDRLMRIGDLEVAGATMGTVIDALRGKPGETRALVLERNGERISVDARVTRLL
jgi:C-terminal processing protease CtpA/Prc